MSNKRLYDYYFFPFEILRTGCEVTINGRTYWDNSIVFDKNDRDEWRMALTYNVNKPYSKIEELEPYTGSLIFLKSSSSPDEFNEITGQMTSKLTGLVNRNDGKYEKGVDSFKPELAVIK